MENVVELLKYIEINNHAIKLEKGNQSFFSPIYSLKLIKLETLKTYTKIKVVNRFIQSFKSSTGAIIIFDWKLNGYFRLCVNYQNLNNLTIRN